MLYQAQAVLRGKSGLPHDVFVNNFFFEDSGELPVGIIEELPAVVWNFYDNAGTLAPVRQFLSPVIDQNDHTVKVYRLDDPKPRVPLVTATLDFTAAIAGTALPTEVSVCLSFRADVVSGQPMARRRGRVYVGPLNTSGTAPDAVGSPRPATPLVTTLLDAAERLADNARAAGFNWVIHSATTAALARYPVLRAWVDSAFDTQRRRGVEPDSRVERLVS